MASVLGAWREAVDLAIPNEIPKPKTLTEVLERSVGDAKSNTRQRDRGTVCARSMWLLYVVVDACPFKS